MTRELPIIFNGPSVRAVLAGQKAQTRRVVTADNSTVNGSGVRATSPAWSGLRLDEARARTKTTLELAMFGDGASLDPHLDAPWDHPNDRPGLSGCVLRVRSKLEPGDALWVREAWRYHGWTEDGEPWIEYRADDHRRLCGPDSDEWAKRLVDIWADLSTRENLAIDGRAADRRWRSSRFMPKWAARLWLRVEAVRVERLQEISEEDAKSEGVDPLIPGHGPVTLEELRADPGMRTPRMYRDGFSFAWSSLHDKPAEFGASWAADPWVWIITFSRLAECEVPK